MKTTQLTDDTRVAIRKAYGLYNSGKMNREVLVGKFPGRSLKALSIIARGGNGRNGKRKHGKGTTHAWPGFKGVVLQTNRPVLVNVEGSTLFIRDFDE